MGNLPARQIVEKKDMTQNANKRKAPHDDEHESKKKKVDTDSPLAAASPAQESDYVLIKYENKRCPAKVLDVDDDDGDVFM